MSFLISTRRTPVLRETGLKDKNFNGEFVLPDSVVFVILCMTCLFYGIVG